jgi:hypothetical protein
MSERNTASMYGIIYKSIKYVIDVTRKPEEIINAFEHNDNLHGIHKHFS